MKLALVVASAACMWDDVKAALDICGKFDSVYCVKRAGIHWPEPFKVWVTLHPEYMDKFEAERRAKRLPGGYEIVAPLPGELGEHAKKGRIARRVSYRWPGMAASASSGPYGAKIAMDDGHTHVVLAGCPFDNTRHIDKHHRYGDGGWTMRDSFKAGLMKAIPHMQGRVKSMSGLTKELLGVPTKEWLTG